MKGDLTDRSYWAYKQKNMPHVDSRLLDIPEWFNVAEPFLKAHEGKSFLELGCSPGTMSAAICSRIQFVPYGVDFSPQAHLYLENMERIGYANAQLIQSDLRDFETDIRFDVVASFGLIEHFEDPLQILFHHDRLTKARGLVLVVIPNFRYVQWLYHFLFDRVDLAAHNLKSMDLGVFRDFSRVFGYRTLFLGYYGRMTFWGVDLNGGRVTVQLRRAAARLVRDTARILISRSLPVSLKYSSPWIVYIGQKP